MLWFNFILGFKVIIIHYHTPKQEIIKFKPRIYLVLQNLMRQNKWVKCVEALPG